jgi:outer membrane protein assembly factor BamB
MPTEPLAASLTPSAPRHEALLGLLVGGGAAALELPPLFDLIAIVLALAEGQRRKAILPLTSSTGEFAMVRRGEQALVSYYDSGPVPQIFVRDRAVPLARLLEACAAAADELAGSSGQGAIEKTARIVAERARRVVVTPDRQTAPVAQLKRGGAQTANDNNALEFGYSARVIPSDLVASEAGSRADVHALLFDGELWAFARGRRIALLRGPVYPAIARMVNAARAVVDAWESQRPVHLRLKAGDFGIAVRLTKSAELSLSLTSGTGDVLTMPAMDVSSIVLPILRLASDLVRTVVSADRSQHRNLRLAALRDEVRALRRTVRARSQNRSFVNSDPDLLRASAVPHAQVRERTLSSVDEPSGKLRLSVRWRAEIDGLDAGSTFLCGDRLVVATARSQLALSRDSGELLWMRHSSSVGSWMAGSTLVSVSADGEVELCDVRDGETYARSRIAPRVGGSLVGLCAGGRSTPPVAVITEGKDRLVALDVRTGEPRWRFRSRGRGNFRLTRAGRILLVVSGDSTLDALDVATGEVAWRWSDPARITLAPVITREHAIAVAGHAGASSGALLCFDLFSGQLVFRRELEGGPLTSPVATDQVAVLPVQRGSNLKLVAHDLTTSEERFACDDPGLGEGGSPLVVDQHLVINTPSGTAFGVDLVRGGVKWQHRMADPMRDDVPRRLEPVLRGGALFIPSASVHVVRPADGSVIGGPIADGIIPDVMRVDERGWLYLAEESGHVEAYAPAPSLRLVRS